MSTRIPASQKIYLCSGCFSSFNRSGFAHHIAQSTNPACSVFAQISDLAPEMVQDEDEMLVDDDELQDDVGIRPFEGDFFGESHEYAEEDFGWPGSDNEESDAEEDLAQEDAQAGVGEGQGDSIESQRVPEIERPSLPQPAPTNVYIERFADKFPGTKAGTLLPSNLDASSSFDHYNRHLGHEDNIYHPFKSRLDWQVARWAKMRGLGSNAVSELLKIENVSIPIYTPMNY